MGFFSKVFKKVKKGFKSFFKGIGKRVKKAFKSFGKFMNKIGIVGQVAMSFVLPGIGAALSRTAGAAFRGITGALARGGNIAKAAGKMIEASGNFAKMGHSAFKTVTDGVSSFVTEMGGAALANMPGAKTMFPKLTNKSFKAAWNNVEAKFVENTGKIMTNFDNLIGNNVVNPTAVEAAALSKAQAVTGEGLTPSATAEVKGFDMSTVGPDGASLDKPFYPTPDGTLNVSADKPFYPTLSGEMPGILDSAGLETVGPDGLALDKKPFYPTPSGTANVATAKIKKPSLLDKASDFVKDTVSNVVDEIKAAPSKIPEYAGEFVEKQIKTEVMEEFVGEPEPIETLSSGYVMPYQDVTVGQYESQAINDRAYQMALDPVNYGMQNPFGYPAQDFYKQQMLQFSRPAQ